MPRWTCQDRATWAADLFDAASIDAIVALFLAFVTESVQRPDASVTDLWSAGVARMRAGASGPDVARLIDAPASPSGTWYPLSPAQPLPPAPPTQLAAPTRATN
jgi:hypothetical protein